MPRAVADDTFVAGDDFSVGDITQSQSGIRLAALPGGGFVSVWMDYDGTNQVINGQLFDGHGDAAGSVFQVSPETAANPSRPTVTVLESGDFLVTWTGSTPGSASFLDIAGQMFEADGTPIGSEFIVNTTTDGAQTDSVACALSDGGFVVLWASGQTIGQRFDASGAKVGGEFTLSFSEPTSDVNVVGLSGGGFVASWFSTNGDFGVRAQVFQANGTPAGAAFQVNSFLPGHQNEPTIAALPDGGFVVAWVDEGFEMGPTGHGGIWLQRFDAAGTKVGAEVQVSASTTGNFDAATIEVVPGTGFLVTWAYGRNEGLHIPGHLRAQLIDLSGAKIGAEFTVTSVGTSDQRDPDLAVLSNGNLAVGWTDVSGVLSDLGVRAEILHTPLYGTAAGDLFAGTADPDYYLGGAGNDQLSGAGADDYLSGGADADTLNGGDGNDTLDGGAGTDTMTGGTGDDTFHVNTGYDVVVEAAGEGSDTVLVTTSYTLGAAAEIEMLRPESIGATTALTLTGNGFANVILGNLGNNTLNGGGGNDTLNGILGTDTLNGGAGDDTLEIIHANTNPFMPPPPPLTVSGTYDGGTGNDLLSVGGSIVFEGTLSGIESVFFGAGGASTNYFGYLEMDLAQFSTLSSTASFSGAGGIGVTLQAGDSFDASGFQVATPLDTYFVFYGDNNASGAPMTWVGSMTNDAFHFGAGTVTVTGGAGEDVFRFDPLGLFPADITITDYDPVEDVIDLYDTGLATFESLSDFLTQDGDDLVFSATSNGVTTRVVLEDTTLAELGDANDLWLDYNYDPVVQTGGALDDVLLGNGGVDELHGGAGNDRLYTGGQAFSPAPGYFDAMHGDDGDDTIVVDAAPSLSGGIYHGGLGFDTLDLRVTPTSGFYPMASATITGIERIRFGSEADESIFTVLSMSQAETSGLTQLVGGGGNDTLLLTVAGGGGTFTMPNYTLTDWASSAAPHLTFGDMLSLAAGGPGDFVLNAREGLGSAQSLFGGIGNDTLNGSSGVDMLNGNGGVNVLNGNGGDDVLNITNSIVTAYTGAGSAFNGGAGTDTLLINGPVNFQGAVSSIEALHLVLATGSAPATALTIGASTMTALGASLPISGSGSITVNLAPGNSYTAAGFTLAAGATVTHVVNGSSANDVIGGMQIGDTLNGNAGNDLIRGYGGNDVINGGIGADIMQGGLGDDWLYVDNAGDVISEAAGQGANDRVLASVSYELSAGVHVERLTTSNSAATVEIHLTGNEIANVIYGNAGFNSLDGKEGADTLLGLGGNDWYSVDNAGDVVIEAANEGFDVILAGTSYVLRAGSHVEQISAYPAIANVAINLTGNELVNFLIGNAGANILDGGGGADNMTGMEGDDWYYVDNAGDEILEQSGQGTLDRVYASVSYTLGAGVQVERLNTADIAGTSAINLTGNALGNIIYGNAGVNTLNGAGGADLLAGFAGNDLYYVDHASDAVSETVGNGTDRILTSVSYTLAAGSHVEWLTTTSNGGTAALHLTGNELANAIYGNAGANVLDGKGGADTLIGLDGADSFAFTTALGSGNIDAISGFVVADDTVLLDDAVFTGLAAGALAAGAFATGSAATEADDRIVYNSATGALLFDADGSGAGAAVQFATLAGGLALTSADFLVV